MLATMLDSGQTSEGVLDYNETKVMRGRAEVVHFKNIANDLTSTIYQTFDRYETNPSIRKNFKDKVFHIALNPGPEDICLDHEVAGFVDELMQRLGYEGQPYVLYKHKDIEREHYHLVASRIKPDGRSVKNNRVNELQVCINAIKELGPRYNFTFGREQERERERQEIANGVTMEVRSFVPGQKDLRETIRADYEWALGFDFESLFQFQLILFQLNLVLRKARKKNGEGLADSFTVYGLKDYKMATRLYSVKDICGKDAYARFEKRLEENKTKKKAAVRTESFVTAKEAVGFALQRVSTITQLEAVITECGFRPVVSQNENGLNHFLLMDDKEKHIYSYSDLFPGRTLDDINSLKLKQGRKITGEFLTDREKREFKERVKDKLFEAGLIENVNTIKIR